MDSYSDMVNAFKMCEKDSSYQNLLKLMNACKRHIDEVDEEEDYAAPSPIPFSDLKALYSSAPADPRFTGNIGLSPTALSVTIDLGKECTREYPFPTIMHAFQAHKELYSKDIRFDTNTEYNMVSYSTVSLAEANTMGSEVNLRVDDWDRAKRRIMKQLMQTHLEQCPSTLKKLKDHKGDILENQLPDFYWGYHVGSGRNEIGKIWMELRDQLRDQAVSQPPRYDGDRGSKRSRECKLE